MTNTGVTTRIQGTRYNQFGNDVLSTQMRFSLLEAMFEIDHEVQRQLDPRRRAEIREFILSTLVSKEPFYFSPFIFSSRASIHEVAGGFELKPGSKIFVLDGQHRGAAISSAISYLKTQKEAAEEINNIEAANIQQKYIDQLSALPIAMQIYLDLDQQSERQLFSDYNTERKEAHKGLVIRYDHRDKYGELAREVAKQLESKLDIEAKASRLTCENSAITSTITMRKCLIAMFEGKLTKKTGDPYYRNCKPTDVPHISNQFFAVWVDLFPKKSSDKKVYVSSLSGIQIALAYTVHLLTKDSFTHIEAIGMLKLLNKQHKWKHTDEIFTHMYSESTKQLKNHSTTTAIKRTALLFLSAIDKERDKGNDYK